MSGTLINGTTSDIQLHVASSIWQETHASLQLQRENGMRGDGTGCAQSTPSGGISGGFPEEMILWPGMAGRVEVSHVKKRRRLHAEGVAYSKVWVCSPQCVCGVENTSTWLWFLKFPVETGQNQSWKGGLEPRITHLLQRL